MKITFILHQINLSGGVRVVVEYAKQLSSLGHEVTIVSSGTHKLNFLQKIFLYFGVKSPLINKNDKSSDIYFKDLKDKVDLKILKNRVPVTDKDVPDADIVIATWWRTAEWVMRLTDSKGKKVYFTQDYGEVANQPMNELIKTWEMPFSKIITISSWLEKVIRDNSSKKLVNLITIVNGVDFNIFKTPQRKMNTTPTIGFLYVSAPQKGADIVLSAFIKAKKIIPELTLILFGSQTLPDEYSKLDNVKYFQKVPNEKLPKIYSSCNFWLFASRREGFGLPILEAMSCRTPVIATNAGAAMDIVNNDCGKILVSFEPDEMARAIVDMCNLSPSQWQNLSENAYAKSKLFSWESAGSQFEKALYKAIES